ncbi:hypothetical protein BC629DRAFT_1721440 [Irpex lacteus]|nr:hypothetical protein BC629DRAFT_1721440 [Irpex lacteus]
MAIAPSAPMYSAYTFKRRRTATSVLAGDFDPRPSRDVLTSVLNGVPVYDSVEKAEMEEERRARKKEKKEREKQHEQDKKRAKSLSIAPERPQVAAASTVASSSNPAKRPQPVPAPRVTPPTTSSFWQARPSINITGHRSNSVTPPPMPPSSPPSTPDPSLSSATSTASSKRPHTPEDGDNFTDRGRSVGTMSPQPDQVARPPRKKRQAARKGWKGWVEGSPPPSEKLINLDVVPLLGERKTRSGKSFDAIGVGKDSWV